jgi:hypothetical protein
MPAADYSVRELAAWQRSHPVVLSSPFPAGECVRRLAAVTTRRSAAFWYLDSRTALRPDPRLRGEISLAQISVVLFPGGGKNSYRPRLDVRLEPAAEGGTMLTGTVGMQPGARTAGRVINAVAALILLGFVAGGVSRLVAGHIDGLVLALLAPAVAIALAWGLEAAGVRSLRQDIPQLLGEVNEILGSAGTFARG